MSEVIINRRNQYLPPQDYWNFASGEKVPTPVDERGLVKVPELIQIVKDSVSPTYIWSRKTNIHHFYYEAALYSNSKSGPVNPFLFRELTTSKGLMPRDFHALIHARTLPPEVPESEVMALQVESWIVAARLFTSMKEVIKTERRTRKRRADIQREGPYRLARISPVELEDKIGEEYWASEFRAHFEGHEAHLEAAQSIPKEFRLFDPEDAFEDLVSKLGSMVVPKALPLYHAVYS